MMAVFEFLRSIWGLWLMAIFLGIVWWAFRPANKAKWERQGEMILRDDDKSS